MNNDFLIKKRIDEISKVAEMLPGVVIILNIPNDFTVEYMSEKGAKNLGVTLEYIKSLGADYHKVFFNSKDAEYYVPKLQELVQRNNIDEVFTFFQQVKPLGHTEWQWYLSSMQLLLKSVEGNPLLAIFIAIRIDSDYHLTKKVSRLLEDNIFFRDNYVLYESLTKREKEILKLMAQNKGNKMIADELFISVNTVETHKKNLKSKLGVDSVYDLMRIAYAFE